MQLKKLIYILIIFCFSPTFAQAQINNIPFEKPILIDTTASEDFKFNLRVLGFNKNNEYYNKINEGYTLFGYRLTPSVSWQFQKNFKVEGGIFLQKDFGNNKFTYALPYFNMLYSWRQNQLILGNINGSIHHRQIEPMEDFERLMNDIPENGLQFLRRTEKLFLDAWVNWETMIYPGSDFKEKLSGGLVIDRKLMQKPKQELTFHYEFKGYHTGGQIDIVEQPLVIVFNNSAGFSWQHDLVGEKLNNIKFEGHFLHFTDQSNETRLVFTEGYGYYLNGQLSTHFGDFMLSYWYGDQFYSYKGGRLYQSISTNLDSEYSVDVRQLLILRILNEIKIGPQTNLVLRFEPFWDLQNKKFEFSHALYFNVFKTFSMRKQ
jgi:hypothetical protein